jgi:HK97 family phage prohead protease
MFEYLGRQSFVKNNAGNLRKGVNSQILKAMVDGVEKITAVISTERRDRDGDTIRADGWELENYKANPVILFAHKSHELPVGRSSDVYVRGGSLYQQHIDFTPREVYELGYTIGEMMKLGYLNAFSVGFSPIEWDHREDGGIDFKRQELLENSVVPVPANPQALVEAKANGMELRAVKEWAGMALDTWEEKDGLLIPRDQLEAAYKVCTGSGCQIVKTTKAAPEDTLYIKRPVLNGDAFKEWAGTQGFGSVVAPSDMHVTVVFSKEGAPDLAVDSEQVVIPAESLKEVKPLGDEGAVVLRFESEALTNRWQEAIDAGASWDYDSYQPHMTISYAGSEVDLSKVELPDFEMVLGGEIHEEVNLDWVDNIQEEETDMADEKQYKGLTFDESWKEMELSEEFWEAYRALDNTIFDNLNAMQRGDIDAATMAANVAAANEAFSAKLNEMFVMGGEDTTEPPESDQAKSVTKAAISYDEAHPDGTPLAPEETEWDGPAEIAAADVDGLKVMSAWVDEENEDIKQGYKLPHHEAAGDHRLVWRGVVAAMGALLGARGGVEIPEADRQGVYDHLAQHYAEFEQEAPEFRMIGENEEFDFESGKVVQLGDTDQTDPDNVDKSATTESDTAAGGKPHKPSRAEEIKEFTKEVTEEVLKQLQGRLD